MDFLRVHDNLLKQREKVSEVFSQGSDKNSEGCVGVNQIKRREKEVVGRGIWGDHAVLGELKGELDGHTESEG